MLSAGNRLARTWDSTILILFTVTFYWTEVIILAFHLRWWSWVHYWFPFKMLFLFFKRQVYLKKILTQVIRNTVKIKVVQQWLRFEKHCSGSQTFLPPTAYLNLLPTSLTQSFFSFSVTFPDRLLSITWTSHTSHTSILCFLTQGLVTRFKSLILFPRRQTERTPQRQVPCPYHLTQAPVQYRFQRCNHSRNLADDN